MCFETPSSDLSSPPSPTPKRRTSMFPLRLYDMLENAEAMGFDHIISWMPNGKSFKIHGIEDEADEQLFVHVLRDNSFTLTRYRSFLRQLQLYGFERTYRGPNRGECKHDLFVRGHREWLLEKSTEHFQRNYSPEVNDQLLSTDRIFILNDQKNYWTPQCAYLSSGMVQAAEEYIRLNPMPPELFLLDTDWSSGSSSCSSEIGAKDEDSNKEIKLNEEGINADWLFFQHDMK